MLRDLEEDREGVEGEKGGEGYWRGREKERKRELAGIHYA